MNLINDSQELMMIPTTHDDLFLVSMAFKQINVPRFRSGIGTDRGVKYWGRNWDWIMTDGVRSPESLESGATGVTGVRSPESLESLESGVRSPESLESLESLESGVWSLESGSG